MAVYGDGTSKPVHPDNEYVILRRNGIAFMTPEEEA